MKKAKRNNNFSSFQIRNIWYQPSIDFAAVAAHPLGNLEICYLEKRIIFFYHKNPFLLGVFWQVISKAIQLKLCFLVPTTKNSLHIISLIFCLSRKTEWTAFAACLCWVFFKSFASDSLCLTNVTQITALAF